MKPAVTWTASPNCESASSFEATGDVIGQCNLFPRDPKDHLARLDHYKTAVFNVDTSGDVLKPGVVIDVVDLGICLILGIVPKRKIDGAGSDLRSIERFDPDGSILQCLLDLCSDQYTHCSEPFIALAATVSG